MSNTTNNFYYAIFEKMEDGILVKFPDIDYCITDGATWEEAYEMAKDALAGALVVEQEELRSVKRSSHEELKEKLSSDSEIVPIPVDEKIMELYEPKKRFNVIFSTSLLNQVDQFRKKANLKRSTLLANAVTKYIAENT